MIEHLILSLQNEKVTTLTVKNDLLKAKDREIAAENQHISAQELEITEKSRGLISLQQKCGSLQAQLPWRQCRGAINFCSC